MRKMEVVMKEIRKTHVGSYAVIIKDKKIALIKKARGGYKGKYDLPGGGIEHDETPIEGLYRECREEIGREVKKATLLDVTSVTFKWQMTEDTIEDLHHIGILFQVEIDNDALKTEADGLDSLGAKWIDINELTQDVTSPFVWHILNKLGYK
jgi:ADP-ribose pyrophosphatase YjhB (NUDIX family)